MQSKKYIFQSSLLLILLIFSALTSFGQSPPVLSGCPEYLISSTEETHCYAHVTYAISASGDPAPVVSYTFTGATSGSGSGTGIGLAMNKGVTLVTITAVNSEGTQVCSFPVLVNDIYPPMVICPPDVTIPCPGSASLGMPSSSEYCPQSGIALNFDGIDDYVAVPQFYPATPDFTMELWFKDGGSVGHTQMISWTGQREGASQEILLGIQPDNTIRLGLYDYYNLDGFTLSGTTNVRDGMWHHVAATCSGSFFSLYVDGILQSTGTISPFNQVRDYVYGLTIGAASTVYNPLFELFNGTLDEIRIWSTARSQSDIQWMMHKELQGTESGLVSYYKLDQGEAYMDNTGITEAFAVPGRSGLLENFALTGSLSNFVPGHNPGISISNNAPTSFGAGTTLVTWSVSDAAGNTATCVQSVSVTAAPPVITCPEAININTATGDCGAAVYYPEPVVEVSCPCTSPDYIPGYSFVGIHNGHKYFLSDYETSWTIAHNSAVSLGVNLASVQNLAENTFLAGIASIIGNSIWIGFTDQDNEGTFTWTDGSAVTFTNWSPGEPNNLGGEDYTELYGNGVWNDIPDNVWLKRAVIEFPCTGLVRTGGLSSGSWFPVGTTEVSYSYDDAHGNVVSCSFPVTVTDAEAPVIDCPADIWVSGVPGECGNIITLEPPVATDNCFSQSSLTTTFAGGNGNFGSMFDIVTLKSVKIKNFIGHIRSGTHQIDFYYKTGSHVGSEHNPANWTFLGSAMVTGYDAPALIPFDVNIDVPAGQTVSFFIAGTGAFNYSNGSAVGAIAAQNDDVQILIGKSRMEWTEGSSIFQPRIWNGTLNYEVNSILVSQISGPASGSLFPTGTNTVVWQATDMSGNTSTCTQLVTVTYDSVVYTVGSGGSFPNLTGEGGLFQYLNSAVAVPVVHASIISDLSEPGTYALEAVASLYPCAPVLVRIAADGEILRTVSGNVAQAMIRLDGAERVTFIGGSADLETGGSRYLCFRNLNPSYPTILLQNSAGSNRFLSCIIEGANTNAASGVFVLGGTVYPIGNSHNFLFNNLFSNIPTANTPPANLFFSSGNQTAPNSDNSLLKNEFRNFDQKGIALIPGGNGSNWHLIHNSFYLTTSPVANANKTFVDFQPGSSSDGNLLLGNHFGGSGPMATGMLTVSGAGTLKGLVVNAGECAVSQSQFRNMSFSNTGVCNFTAAEITSGLVAVAFNDVSGITVAGTGTVYGILAGGTSASDISDCYIHDIVFTKTSGSPVFRGIQLKKGSARKNSIHAITATQANLTPTFYGIANVASGLTSPNQIYNNMISITAGASAKAKVYGLFDQSIGIGADFYHNTVSLSGITTNAYFTAAFYRIGNGQVNVYNNILSNTRISTSLAKHYAIANNSPYYWMSNYNCLYTASASLGMWNSSNFNTFSTWKMMTGQDANSINVAPAFVSATDLHLTVANSLLDNKGGTMFSFGTDFDGETRSISTPDMGADEFSGMPLSLEPEVQESLVVSANGNSLKVYPNPFTSSNTIAIHLTEDDEIRVEMYSMMGALIRVVASGLYPAGTHTFSFEAQGLPAGTYLCRFVVNGKESMVKRAELVK